MEEMTQWQHVIARASEAWASAAAAASCRTGTGSGIGGAAATIMVTLQRRPRVHPLLETDHAPVWLPDFAADACTCCIRPFTALGRRRHHCRRCGQVVCHACSGHRWYLRNISVTELSRTCDACASMLLSPPGQWREVQDQTQDQKRQQAQEAQEGQLLAYFAPTAKSTKAKRTSVHAK
jgi:hypothetical protein